MSKYLLVDTNFLCHRAFHTTGELSFRSVRTGVVFGVMRELETLIGWYRPAGIAFCFDSKKNLRKELCPEYKQGRRSKLTKEQKRARRKLDEEIVALRKDYLPSLGFRNIFVQRGYEADDLIAKLAEDIHFTDDAIIVAGDKDLHQCLTSRVKMFNPITRKEFTVDSFRNKWDGLYPQAWARCKAIAGCPTDNIKGVDGVGEATAVQFVLGRLDTKSKRYKAIRKNLDIVNRNIGLVTLPMKGVEAMEWKRDKFTRKKWKRLSRRLGMFSLELTFPKGLKRE
jgi:DNA polymerase-1